MGKAEAYVVVTVVGIVPVTVRHRAVLCIIVPAAATDHTVLALDYSPIFCNIFCRKPPVDAWPVNDSNGKICC